MYFASILMSSYSSELPSSFYALTVTSFLNKALLSGLGVLNRVFLLVFFLITGPGAFLLLPSRTKLADTPLSLRVA